MVVTCLQEHFSIHTFQSRLLPSYIFRGQCSIQTFSDDIGNVNSFLFCCMCSLRGVVRMESGFYPVGQLVGFSLSQLAGELRPSRVAPARLHLFLFPGFSPGLRRAFHSPKDGLFHKTCRKLFHISILVIRTTILGKKIILFIVSRIITELELEFFS